MIAEGVKLDDDKSDGPAHGNGDHGRPKLRQPDQVDGNERDQKINDEIRDIGKKKPQIIANAQILFKYQFAVQKIVDGQRNKIADIGRDVLL